MTVTDIGFHVDSEEYVDVRTTVTKNLKMIDVVTVAAVFGGMAVVAMSVSGVLWMTIEWIVFLGYFLCSTVVTLFEVSVDLPVLKSLTFE